MSKNNQQYNFEKSIVAFIDVLGSSKAIKDNSTNFFNSVHQVYREALKLYNENSKLNVKSNEDKAVKIRIFSDNIVLYSPVCDDLEGCFIQLSFLSAYIQAVFLNKGILVRGGIAIGDFFADDIMIWGNALVDAYQIENSVSIYPRIVIQPMLFHRVENLVEKFNCFAVDADGCCYIDYLNQLIYNNTKKAIDNAKELCKEKLKEAHYREQTENTRAVQKIIWQQNYILQCEKKLKLEL